MIFDKLIIRWAERIHHRRIDKETVCLEENPTRSRRGRGQLTPVGSNRRVEHNYDDKSVINFKIYGASGGMIVETSRYDDKKDNEQIRRYVIDESANVGESIGRIVTMEYLR